MIIIIISSYNDRRLRPKEVRAVGCWRLGEDGVTQPSVTDA